MRSALDSYRHLDNPNPYSARDTITEGKRTHMPHDHSCATSPRFTTQKRGPESAIGTCKQHSRGGTALSLQSYIVG